MTRQENEKRISDGIKAKMAIKLKRRTELADMKEAAWNAASATMRDESAPIAKRLLAALDQMLHVAGEYGDGDPAFDEIRTLAAVARKELACAS